MNKRIKEFAEQSQKIISYTDDGYTANKVLDKEKFALLIIQECVSVCLQQRDPANLNYKPSERFAEVLKQHFGVK